MRISKISLRNFRIYKGYNEVVFANESNGRNISIIAGQNGFGKTTLLSALVWGFYGRLISEVDEKYKREISEFGGYKKYANSNLNRDVKSKNKLEQKYSVEIEITDLYIPSVPCNKLIIKREYDAKKGVENTNVIIDGFENELTKEVGSDIFINDFILPREIAKFFLFDAEKIVSLAEIKSNVEKQKLSKAYSEVLGISKYEILKNNLENLRIKLRKKSASLVDRNRLDKLLVEVEQLKKLISLKEEKITKNIKEIDRSRNLSEQYQEKLIREGNSMTVEDMVMQKRLRDKLREQNIEIRTKLRELIEIVPFAIAGYNLQKLQKQVRKESQGKQQQFDIELVKDKMESIKQRIESKIQESQIAVNVKTELFEIIMDGFNIDLEDRCTTLERVLLDLSQEQSNEFDALYDNIVHSYNILFKQIVKEERNNRIFLSKTLKKISNAEAKETDINAKEYKVEKAKFDKHIDELNAEQNKLHGELGALQQELTTKAKVISELAKTVSLDKIDGEKDKIIERLIGELTEFIFKFKSEKKKSLRDRLKRELHRLMHKEKFIENVDIELKEDSIDINLYDIEENIIEKESLSKGEQQLYATALLKSLVDESGIQFPIFIDSPLQKFDKKHSKNIITEFYPSISKQVILYPLLEKELTENEYSLLFPFINQTFIIRNTNDGSSIVECRPNDLFNEIDVKRNVHSH